MKNSHKLSLIVPVYRNEGTIGQLMEEIAFIARSLTCEFEAVFVVDGSPDNSAAILSDKLESVDFSSRLVALSRNFGSFTAIRQGLQLGTGDLFAVMAADCQEPPELIIESVQALIEDRADVVVGVRESRGDPFFYRIFSQIFWSAYRKTVINDIPRGGVDIFACHSKVRDVLVSLPETHTSLVAQLFWVGFRRVEISYVRRHRLDGMKSGWTFKKRMAYMSDSIFAFTDLPVRALLSMGVIGVLGALVTAFIVLLSWLLGWIDVPGYTPLIMIQLILFAVTLLGFGIVGSYTWRAFENTKLRPLGIVAMEKVFTGKN